MSCWLVRDTAGYSLHADRRACGPIPEYGQSQVGPAPYCLSATYRLVRELMYLESVCPPLWQALRRCPELGCWKQRLHRLVSSGPQKQRSRRERVARIEQVQSCL